MPSFAQNLEKTLHAALAHASDRSHEYATLEHLLLALIDDIATILDDVSVMTKVAAKKTAGVLGDDLALNASANPNDLRFINHSCDPNTYMRRAYRQVEFYSKRAIKKGEELTCDYGETHHDGKLPCKCGAKNCRGFI